MKPFAIQFFSSAGLFASALLIPNLAREEFEASNVEIGLIVASYSLALLVSSYIFGRASDVHGRRRVLMAGLALSALSLALQILAMDTISLTLARLLVGFCAGMFPSALMAYVFDSEGRIGRLTAFGALGFGSGVLIAGAIGRFELIFMVSALFMSLAFLVSLMLPFRKEVRRNVPLFPLEVMRRNLPAYGAILLRHTGANMVWVTFPIFLEDLGADPMSIGILYAVNSFTQFTVMQFLDRFNPSRLMLVGLLASAAVFLLFTQADDFWEVLPMEVLLATAWSCLYIGSVNYIMRGNLEKGTSAGLLQSTISVSAIMGSLAGGVVSFNCGYSGSMFVAMGLALLAAAMFLWGDRRAPRQLAKNIC